MRSYHNSLVLENSLVFSGASLFGVSEPMILELKNSANPGFMIIRQGLILRACAVEQAQW